MKLAAIGLFAAAAALTWRPAAAGACSLSRRHVWPTTFEMVAGSDRIVVATARKQAGQNRVEMKVTRLVKGTGVSAGDAIPVKGWMAPPESEAEEPDHLSGFGPPSACSNEWEYAAGVSYILLLAADGAGWQTINSQVEEPIVLRALEEYARVAALADHRRKNAALDALVARGARRGASAADRAIAADVRRHRARPTPAKPFAELVAMLDRAGGPEPSDVLLAIGVGGDPEARRWMRARIREARLGKRMVDQETLSEAIAAYFEKVADPAAIGEVAELYVWLGAKHRHERWPLMHLLRERATGAHTALMVRALAGADDEEAGWLAGWFIRHPTAAALDDVRARTGTAYVRRAEFAVPLAAMGDARVVSWARGRLAGGRGHGREVAIHVLAVSPRAEADAAARKIIRRGGEDLTELIRGYLGPTHPNVAPRLKEIGARSLTREQRRWLNEALARKAQP